MVNKIQLSAAFFGVAMLTACGGASDAPTTPQNTAQTEVQATAASQPAPVSEAVTPPAPTPPPAEPSPEFASLSEPYVNADYARAKRVWRQCSSCHTLSPEADHLVGPNLYGLFERKVGQADGFNYSNALQEADFDWTPEKLNEWLTSPRNFLPGNRMSFRGVRKPEDRINVIAYIISESDLAKTE